MPSVKNLQILKMNGTENTYYATWTFDAGTKAVATVNTTSNIVAGDWVRVKSGSTWYNGAAIPSYVFNQDWQVLEVSGDRVIINKNRDGSSSIMSPININDLEKVGAGGTTQPAAENTTIDTLSHYELMWAYYTASQSGNKINEMWFHGKDATTYAVSGAYDSNATYDPPEQAIKIRVQVRPVSKTYIVNDKETSYWTGTWALKEYNMESVNLKPETPEAPTVELDDLNLTVMLDNISDPRAEKARFEIYSGNSLYRTTDVLDVVTARVSFQCPVDAGGEYRARARTAGMNFSGVAYIWSDWGPFSGSQETIPVAPSGFTIIRAASSSSVYLEWNPVPSAETYDIQYATNPLYLEGSNAATTQTGIETTKYTLTGLESGDEYYFRVRAVNDQGSSSWSSVSSVIIGKEPSAPTTWSSATTVIVGDPLTLYWVHNSEDGSWETYAELEIYFDDFKETHTIKSDQIEDDDGDDAERTHHYSVDTSKYPEGTVIKWRVRTMGITEQYGDWSIQRQVDVYARPTLSLNVENKDGQVFEVLDSFPFTIEAFAGPNTQEPIGYHVEIFALSTYDTVDSIGRPIRITAGSTVYSQYFDTNNMLVVQMSANNLDLANGQDYRINVVVTMNSGLNAESSRDFSVMWTEEQYEPDTEVAIDYNDYAAYLTPYCRDEDGYPVPNVLLSLYRREYNGAFTEIATGLDPQANTVVTDPHPSLDYARYRVVATSTTTGAVSYYDPPAYPIGGDAVVIQWDEEWSNFDTTNPDEALTPLWNGSMIQIRGNIDVAENTASDATLVNYIGRTYPVSYYGTAVDSTATWNMEIPMTDKDTLYALRRLQSWAGDVYVREPSGSGYWANVAVSFSQKHLETTIPVTLDITRVEGGM